MRSKTASSRPSSSWYSPATESNTAEGGRVDDCAFSVGCPNATVSAVAHVLLIVDDATVDTPGDDPNGDGMWTDYDLDVRMVVFGQP